MNKKLNLNYIKYLLKSNKSLLFVISIISFILITFIGVSIQMSLDPRDSSDSFIIVRFMSAFFGMGLSMLVPIHLNKYLYQKNSSDLYLSLPIKRETLFLSQYLFGYVVSVLVTIIPYLLALLCFIFMSFSRIGDALLFALILMCLMFIFQSIIYAIIPKVNNIVDSVVASLVYTFIPLAMFLATISFLYSHIDNCMIAYGFQLEELWFYNYVPQFSNLIVPTLTLVGDAYTYISECYLSFSFWVMIGIASFISAYVSFKNRKGEVSGHITTNPFIYPLIVVLIAYCMLINTNIKDFNVYSLIGLVFCFMILMLLTFFAKRKVKFDFKFVGIFMGLLAISIAIGAAFDATKGFNSLKEIPSQDFDYFNIDVYHYEEDEMRQIYIHLAKDKEDSKLVEEDAKAIHNIVLKYAIEVDDIINISGNYVNTTAFNLTYSNAYYNDDASITRIYEVEVDKVNNLIKEIRNYLETNVEEFYVFEDEVTSY